MEIYQTQIFSRRITKWLLGLVVGAFLLQLVIALSSDGTDPVVANQSLWELEFQSRYEDFNRVLSSSGFFRIEQLVFQSGSGQVLRSANNLSNFLGEFTSTDSFKGNLISALLRILFFTVLLVKFSFLSLIAGFFIARPLIKTYKADNPFGLTDDGRIFDFKIHLPKVAGRQLPAFMFDQAASLYKTKISGIYRLLRSRKLDNQSNIKLLSISLSSTERVDLNLFETFLKNCFVPEDSELGKAVRNIEVTSLRQDLVSSFVLAVAAAHSILQKNKIFSYSPQQLFLIAKGAVNSLSGNYDLTYLKQSLTACAEQGLNQQHINKAETVRIISFGNLLYDFINGTGLDIEKISFDYRRDCLLAGFAETLADSLKAGDKAVFKQLLYNENWISASLSELVDFFEARPEAPQFKSKELKPEEQVAARQLGYQHNIGYEKMAAWTEYRKLFKRYQYTISGPEVCLSIKIANQIRNGQVIFNRCMLKQFILPAEYDGKLSASLEVFEVPEKSGRQNLFFLMR